MTTTFLKMFLRLLFRSLFKHIAFSSLVEAPEAVAGGSAGSGAGNCGGSGAAAAGGRDGTCAALALPAVGVMGDARRCGGVAGSCAGVGGKVSAERT